MKTVCVYISAINMRKLLHNLKLINMSKIILITLITFAESIYLTDKVAEIAPHAALSTPSHMSEDNIVIFLSMITVALEAMKFSEYIHLDTKSMNTSQLIECHGYKAEEHTVISNGYILKLFRIPGCGPSVFFMHGGVASSNEWLMLGDKSLAIILAGLGYDVWLGNARGNTYSRKHTCLSPEDPEFWDFSWHEIGTEDLPASIDHICETTGVHGITYVGASQGTTVVTVLLSELPEYNKKLLGVVLLSVVTYSSNMKTPFIQLLAKMRNQLEAALKSCGIYEVAPHKPPVSTLTEICASSKQLSTLCLTFLFSAVGFDYDQIDYHHIQDQFRSLPSGCSLKQAIHYLQVIASGFFSKYDYGKAGNLKMYGCDPPPLYKLENICTNITIFYSNNDWLSNFEKDVSQMIARLATPPEIFEVECKMWNHMDYIWGKDADSLVYNLVEKMLRKYSMTSCNE